jgi:hypothetical protein
LLLANLGVFAFIFQVYQVKNSVAYICMYTTIINILLILCWIFMAIKVAQNMCSSFSVRGLTVITFNIDNGDAVIIEDKKGSDTWSRISSLLTALTFLNVALNLIL